MLERKCSWLLYILGKQYVSSMLIDVKFVETHIVISRILALSHTVAMRNVRCNQCNLPLVPPSQSLMLLSSDVIDLRARSL